MIASSNCELAGVAMNYLKIYIYYRYSRCIRSRLTVGGILNSPTQTKLLNYKFTKYKKKKTQNSILVISEAEKERGREELVCVPTKHNHYIEAYLRSLSLVKSYLYLHREANAYDLDVKKHSHNTYNRLILQSINFPLIINKIFY